MAAAAADLAARTAADRGADARPPSPPPRAGARSPSRCRGPRTPGPSARATPDRAARRGSLRIAAVARDRRPRRLEPPAPGPGQRPRAQASAAEQYQSAVATVLDVAAPARQPDGDPRPPQARAGRAARRGRVATARSSSRCRTSRRRAAAQVYETWVIVGERGAGPARQLHGRRVRDGLVHLEAGLRPAPGIVVAVTREPRPGATAPTEPIVSAGVAATPPSCELEPASARRPGAGLGRVSARPVACRPRPLRAPAWRGRDDRLGVRRRRPGSGRRRPRPRSAARRPRAAPRCRRGPAARRSIPAEPGATRTNSSPPSGPTVSTSRTDSASDGGDRAQDVVAGLVAAGVVGRREVVDVEDRDRDLAALAAGPGELELEDPARTSARWRGRSAGRCGPAARTTRSARRPSTRAAPVDRDRGEVGDRAQERGARPRRAAVRAGQPKQRPRRGLLDRRRGRRSAAGSADRRVGVRRPRARSRAAGGRAGGRRRRPRPRARPGPPSSSPIVSVELGVGPVGILEDDRRARRADGRRGGADERLERRRRGRRRGRAPRRRRRARSGDRVAGSSSATDGLLDAAWRSGDGAAVTRGAHRTPRIAGIAAA